MPKEGVPLTRSAWTAGVWLVLWLLAMGSAMPALAQPDDGSRAQPAPPMAVEPKAPAAPVVLPAWCAANDQDIEACLQHYVAMNRWLALRLAELEAAGDGCLDVPVDDDGSRCLEPEDVAALRGARDEAMRARAAALRERDAATRQHRLAKARHEHAMDEATDRLRRANERITALERERQGAPDSRPGPEPEPAAPPLEHEEAPYPPSSEGAAKVALVQFMTGAGGFVEAGVRARLDDEMLEVARDGEVWRLEHHERGTFEVHIDAPNCGQLALQLTFAPPEEASPQMGICPS